MPGSEHQRTTTYTLTAGDPMLIDLTTTYSFPGRPEQVAAITGTAYFEARDQEEQPRGQAFPWWAGEAGIPGQNIMIRRGFSPFGENIWAERTLILKSQGLIRVDSDRMTYIVSNPGGPRPASFDTTPGDGLTKVSLRRVR